MRAWATNLTVSSYFTEATYLVVGMLLWWWCAVLVFCVMWWSLAAVERVH